MRCGFCTLRLAALWCQAHALASDETGGAAVAPRASCAKRLGKRAMRNAAVSALGLLRRGTLWRGAESSLYQHSQAV